MYNFSFIQNEFRRKYAFYKKPGGNMLKLVSFFNTTANLFFSSLRLISTISVVFFSFFMAAHAQENDIGAQENKEEYVERITVTGGIDAAMHAFNSGDFQLAETKFKENAFCTRQAERNKRNMYDNMQNASINQEVSANPSSDPSFSTASNPKQNISIRKHTCKDRAFQLYMAGLSQLQLDRPADAEDSFERAVTLRSKLYDAHYRLALIKLLRKDTEGVEEHLTSIEETLVKCDDCDVRDEIIVRINFLKKALSGEIKLHNESKNEEDVTTSLN